MVSPNSWPMGGLLGTLPARVTSEVQKGAHGRIFGDFFREPAQGRIFEWALLRGLVSLFQITLTLSYIVIYSIILHIQNTWCDRGTHSRLCAYFHRFNNSIADNVKISIT